MSFPFIICFVASALFFPLSLPVFVLSCHVLEESCLVVLWVFLILVQSCHLWFPVHWFPESAFIKSASWCLAWSLPPPPSAWSCHFFCSSPTCCHPHCFSPRSCALSVVLINPVTGHSAFGSSHTDLDKSVVERNILKAPGKRKGGKQVGAEMRVRKILKCLVSVLFYFPQ